jgi:hypothetical protein
MPLGGSWAGGVAAAGVASGGGLVHVLHEATLSLYPAGADHEALLDDAIWWGACANGFRHTESFQVALSGATGDRYRMARHVDESHEISIDRTWLIPGATLRDLRLPRHSQFVLVVVWLDREKQIWQRNIFYGVTFTSRSRSSLGVLQFTDDQVLRAQYHRPDSGAAAYTPVPPAGTEFALPFFQEAGPAVGDYLLGHHRFGGGLYLTRATVTAQRPTGTAQVLTLEVDGVLTAATLTIPAGSGEATVTAGVDLEVAPVAGLRWRVTAGPVAADAATLIGVNLEVESVS